MERALVIVLEVVGSNPTLFFLREIYKAYYEETVSSVGRTLAIPLDVTGSNPVLFLLFFFRKEKKYENKFHAKNHL